MSLYVTNYVRANRCLRPTRLIVAQSVAMPWTTFEHFTSIFSFVIEAGGVTTAAVAYYFRSEILTALFEVGEGRASDAQRQLAREGVQQAGAAGNLVLERVENELTNHGHGEGAIRLDELRREAQGRPSSPGGMV